LLWETLSVEQIEQPLATDLARVSDCLQQAINDVADAPRNLSCRLGAPHRAASSHVRQLLSAQW
jgi:malonate decarboxylase gamma subunit